VPVLARHVEREGFPTVTVTMMPAVADHLLTPRVIGVPFPFGHAFGMAGDARMQRTVLRSALGVLAGAARFGTRIDIDIEWPVPLKEAYKSWQPEEPSPIVAMFLKASQPE
jgi:hypothetical protein